MLCDNYVILTVEEGFFSQNWLYIGKCHHNLKNKREARVWIEKVAAIDPGDDQDEREVCIMYYLLPALIKLCISFLGSG